MRIVFPYEEKKSNIFPKIKRPVAEIYFWSKLIDGWLRYKMIVDTGADYTILPRYCSVDLGINLTKDCLVRKTAGVGGQAKVFFLKTKAKIKIGESPLEIPLGFIKSDSIPPLLGREECLNFFRVLFADYKTELIKI